MIEATGMARKLREQIHRFSGKLSPQFSLPQRRCGEEMLYGIQAMQSVHLSKSSRSLEESIPLAKTENRLSRNLDAAGLEEKLHDGVIRSGARRIHRDTLLIMDPSDLR